MPPPGLHLLLVMVPTPGPEGGTAGKKARCHSEYPAHLSREGPPVAEAPSRCGSGQPGGTLAEKVGPERTGGAGEGLGKLPSAVSAQSSLCWHPSRNDNPRCQFGGEEDTVTLV